MADQAPPDELNNDALASVEIPPKLRVHALAKLLGVTSKQALAKLGELGEQVKSAHSSVSREQGERVRDAFAGGGAVRGSAESQPPAEAPAAEASAAEAPSAETSSAETSSAEAPAAEAATAEAPAAEAPSTESSSTESSSTETATAEPGPDTSAAPAGAAFVPPLFLPPDPSAKAGAGSGASTKSDGDAGAEASDSGSGGSGSSDDSDDSDDDSSDESSGRSSRRRRRGRRGRGRGRGEQNDDQSSDPGGSRQDGGESEGGGKNEKSDDSAGRQDKGRSGDGGSGDGGSGDGGSDKENAGKGGGNKGDKSDSPKGGPGKGGPNGGGSNKNGSGKNGSGKNGSGDDEPDEGESGSNEAGSDSDDGNEDGNGGSRRRRRRRRRRGGGGDNGDSSSSNDDPPDTVVHEREPRSKRSSRDRDEVQGISGSTRLEAKRQRRRDGREAGRRRPPILTESEFLARRESVDRVMVVREKPAAGGGEPITQVGVLEDKVLVEHFVTSAATPSMVGNVYIGRVQNVLPSMEAAFIDIGRGRNGVLYAGEVDWAAAGLGGSSRKIEQALKSGDQVLVQVTKDPVGHKGARLTTQISMAGRFLVYVPGGSSTGISRKLPDTERKRLKSILRQVVPDGAGVIIRTASEGVSEEELGRDVDRLQQVWEEIKQASEEAKAAKSNQPKALYEEPDLLVKVIRDLFNEDFGKLVIEGEDAWQTVSAYIERVAPDLMSRVEKYDRHGSSVDVFSAYRIDEQLAKALERKVWLPSGGTLVIDRTEAMTVVDVNTGKFTGSGGNLEETVTRNNLEAAEEVVRQMRLRDIGGMIVVDFIDMVLEGNRDLVLRRLTEALGRDRTRHQVSEVTSLGLVQMTRKRLGTGLVEAFSTPCEHCHGRGLVLHSDPIVTEPDNSRSGNGGSRRGRKSKNSGGGSEQSKASQKQVAHHHSEHPMFRAMAEGQSDADQPSGAEGSESSGKDENSGGKNGGTGQGARKGADSQPRQSGRNRDSSQQGKQPAHAEATGTGGAGRQETGGPSSTGDDDKSAAMAKIEAAVTRSTGPRRRKAQRPQGGQSRDTAKAGATPAAGDGEPTGTKPDTPAPAAVEATETGPAAVPAPAPRRRSRRASRATSAPTVHADTTADEPIRSQIVVPAHQPPPTGGAGSAGDSTGTDSAGADSAGADSTGPAPTRQDGPPAPPARRPRRRAAVRRAGPPVDDEA